MTSIFADITARQGNLILIFR